MKLYVAIVVFLVSGTQFKSIECGKKLDIDGLKDMLKPMSKSCKTKTGVSDDLVAGTAKGQWPKERTLMCYVKCLAVMLKVMNKQGEITLRDVNKQLNILVIEDLAPRMKQILDDCFASNSYFDKFKKIRSNIEDIEYVYFTATPSNDACEYAFNLVVCGYKADPSLYFLPT